jgi:hypothetical protein
LSLRAKRSNPCSLSLLSAIASIDEVVLKLKRNRAWQSPAVTK